ncbi:MAG TPA: hypothetical protein VJJ23_05265 [Candidatus Nanoarchaeia archaeon]|nr:hypothetical protein [Candidatus Nanoarchaeia archaeon]
MTLLYIDTNIFIDFVKDRTNIYGKDISTPATKLFFNTFSCKYHIIISTWTLNQIYKEVKTEDIAMLFNMLNKKIIIENYDEKDKLEANQRSTDNFEDALHIILAEKTKADIIVTRNISHFIKIGTKIPIKRPEDV